MQWWSNPSARSHLEAWVNIWVRSAGLALVLAGWFLVGAKKKKKRQSEAWFCAVFFSCFCLLSFYARMRGSCDKQSAKCAWVIVDEYNVNVIIDGVSLTARVNTNMPQIIFCSCGDDIKNR